MDTCAEFLINDPRLGEPTLNKDMPRRSTKVSNEILRPIRDAVVKKGFVASEISGGKPWGSGCSFGEGKFCVSVFLWLVPSEERKRWEGILHIIPTPPLWRRLPGIRDRAAGEQMVEKVAQELKLIFVESSSIKGIRWVSLQRLCSSKGYSDD